MKRSTFFVLFGLTLFVYNVIGERQKDKQQEDEQQINHYVEQQRQDTGNETHLLRLFWVEKEVNFHHFQKSALRPLLWPLRVCRSANF